MAIEQEEGMPVETASLFATVIQEHLELRRRNAALEHEMPLEKYMPDDPFENHRSSRPRSRRGSRTRWTASQSIVDEPTSLDWPTLESSFAEGRPHAAESEETQEAVDESDAEASDENLWSRSRDFDWGD